jgi:SAM-dependent methyltransferase
MSPPSHYDEEAMDLLRLLAPPPGGQATLLELGTGGGSLASHLGKDFRLTLTDLSPSMLAVCRAVTPGAEHLAGDMRTLDLGRTFDRVLVHDPIMYMRDERDLRAALATARKHCRDDGLVALLPDCVKETFAPSTETGGEDGPDGRALRYLEWTWDPDPSDTTFEALYAIVMRDAAGRIDTVTDRHRLGLFPRATWVRLIEEAGFATPEIVRDPWNRDVFLARPARSLEPEGS